MARRSSSNGSERRERAMVLGMAGMAVLALLVLRLFTLQVVHRDTSLAMSEKNWLRPEILAGRRGRILDRHGAVLADVVPSYAVRIDTEAEVFRRDPEALQRTLDAVAELLDDDGMRFRREVDAQRRKTYRSIRLRGNVDIEVVTRVEENRSRLPGVVVEEEPLRYYPGDSLAAHVLGYAGEVSAEELERLSPDRYRPGSQIGKTGIEKEYEDLLRGEDGIRYVEVNAAGRQSQVFLRAKPVPPRPGRDVYLTLDASLQRIAEEAMTNAPFDGRGKAPEVRGAAVVMDVRTGDILAMVSRPGFDTNVFTAGLTNEEWAALQRPAAPMINRSIQSVYPPASTYKMLVLYAALAEGYVTPTKHLAPCYGGYQFGVRRFRCWKRAGHGYVNGVEAISHSCDVYFYQVGQNLGVDRLAQYGNLFKVAEPTGIDLPRESKGLVPDTRWYDENRGRQGWSHGVALNLSIGQGEILLSPLQITEYTSIVATRGKRPRPRLLHAIGPRAGDGAEVVESESEVVTIPLETAHMDVVRQGMRSAVLEGTAQIVNFPEVAVAAKTGTAENALEDHAVFTAFAPYDDPRIAITVYLENRGHGGAAAGPVARKILMGYFGLSDSLQVRIAGGTD